MGIADMAYIYLEPCGCCTAIAMVSVPDMARTLSTWRRWKPKGTIDLLPYEEAIKRVNMKYPKEHQHQAQEAPK